MPGAQRTRGRLCKKSTRVSNHRYAAMNRPSLRDGFTAYFVLLCPQNLPECATGLFGNRHSRN
jgi:hypothetical protein